MDAPVKALNTEKAKALAAALAQIEKQFGKGFHGCVHNGSPVARANCVE